MSAIKSILSNFDTDAETPAPKPYAAKTRAAQDEPTLQPVAAVDAKVAKAKFTTVPDVEVETPSAVQAKPSKPARRAKRVATPDMTQAKALANKIITPRRVALVLLVLMAVWFPAVLLAFFFLPIVCVVIAFLVFGSDRVWGRVSKALQAYEKRSPKRASKLLDRLDGFAVHWDAFLDRFPDGSVDGLYLPDFANFETIEEEHENAMADRLDRMHSQV